MVSYRLSFLGLQVLLLAYTAQSFVLLTANIDDIKKLARKFVSDSLADKLADLVVKATAQMTEQMEEPSQRNDKLKQRNIFTTDAFDQRNIARQGEEKEDKHLKFHKNEDKQRHNYLSNESKEQSLERDQRHLENEKTWQKSTEESRERNEKQEKSTTRNGRDTKSDEKYKETDSIPSRSKNFWAVENNDISNNNIASQERPKHSYASQYVHLEKINDYNRPKQFESYYKKPNNDIKESYNNFKESLNQNKESKFDLKKIRNGFKVSRDNIKESREDAKESGNDFKETLKDFKVSRDEFKGSRDDIKESRDDIKESRDDFKESRDDFKESRDVLKVSRDYDKESRNGAKESGNDFKESRNDFIEPHNDFNNPTTSQVIYSGNKPPKDKFEDKIVERSPKAPSKFEENILDSKMLTFDIKKLQTSKNNDKESDEKYSNDKNVNDNRSPIHSKELHESDGEKLWELETTRYRGDQFENDDVTTVKEKTDFDQYDNRNYHRKGYIATSGQMMLPRMAEPHKMKATPEKLWWEKELKLPSAEQLKSWLSGL